MSCFSVHKDGAGVKITESAGSTAATLLNINHQMRLMDNAVSKRCQLFIISSE